MAYDPDERFWKRDQDGYDPSQEGPEAKLRREEARRRGYNVDMDERACEKEPSRCARLLPDGLHCNGAQCLEAAAFERVGPVGRVFEHTIVTRWPVAVCRRCGAREEL